MRLSTFLISAALAGTAATASAQVIPTPPNDIGPTVSKSYPIALSVNYTAMIGNAPPGTCGCFLLNGGSSEGLFHVWKSIATVAELSGNRSGQVPQSQQGISLVAYMAGPRYSFRAKRRLAIYGQFLIGGAHGFDTYIPRDVAHSSGAANSFAYDPGGGIELGVNDWLSLRAVEADYLVTHLPNDVSTYQHSVRISSGVVFRFSTSRLGR